MARGRRKSKRQPASPARQSNARGAGGASISEAVAASEQAPPPPVADDGPAGPVGLPGQGGIVEIRTQPDRPVALEVPGPVAVTVARDGGDLVFDLGTDGTLALRGFLSLHEEGRAPPLSVGETPIAVERIVAALDAGQAQYGNGNGSSHGLGAGATPVVAVPAGEGIGVVGLLGPDGLAFEMPQLGAADRPGEGLPPLAVDKVFALPEDLAAPYPIVGRLFDEDDPGEPTRYLSSTGAFRTAQGGEVVIGVDGLFEYQAPEGGFDGEDSFAFTVSDGVRSDSATVTIVAAPVPEPAEAPGWQPEARHEEADDAPAFPEPAADTDPGDAEPTVRYDTAQDSALEIGPDRGLLEAYFAAGYASAQVLDSGTIVTAMGGSVEMEADGAFAYMPRPGFVGSDYFAVTMETGQGEPERVLSVVIDVAESMAAPAPERAPRFALMEIPIGADAAEGCALVTVALAESREVVRPAHYLALDYHDGAAWVPFRNGGDVPLPGGTEQLTLRALALDEGGNPLFQTPDAFEVAAVAPDGRDLIAGEPRCWLTEPAEEGVEAEDSTALVLAAGSGAEEEAPGEAEPELSYVTFDIPFSEEDRADGTVTLLVTYDGQAELPNGVSMQLEYRERFAWMPFDNGGVVPADALALRVRAALTAADGSALPADPSLFEFALSRPSAEPAEADPEEEWDAEAAALPTAPEIDVPLPPAPEGARGFTLWVSDDEGEGEHLELAWLDGEVWRAFASGDALPLPPDAGTVRVRLSVLDESGDPLPVSADRFGFEALPVARPAAEPQPAADQPAEDPPGLEEAAEAAAPGEPEEEARPDWTEAFAPPEADADPERDAAGPAAAAAEASAPAAPAENRPDYVFHGESVDPTGGVPLPLAFDALAWAWAADEDWPSPWRGLADVSARKAALAEEARADEAIEEEAAVTMAPVTPPEEQSDFDPAETYALVFNIDVSGSMAWSFDGRQKPALMYEESRLGVAVDAIKRLLRLFVDEGFAGRTRVRFQPFTNRFVEDDAAVFPDLTDMAGIHRYLDGLFAGGITRYEPVMEAAAEWFAEEENRGRFNRIYVLSDGGDNVGYQPISMTVRQLYTAYNGPGQPNLDIYAYGLGAGADELEPERLGALKTGKVVLDPLAPGEEAEKANVVLVTAPENLFAVLADTAPSGDPNAKPAFGGAGGVVMGGEGEADRPVGVVRNRLMLGWQLGEEGTIHHPAVSTVPEFHIGDVGKDPLASVADISGLLPASLARRPRDLSAYVQAGVRGRDLEIHVDVDGSIQGFQPQQIIVLRGCGTAFSPETESDSILKQLIESGNLVIASQR